MKFEKFIDFFVFFIIIIKIIFIVTSIGHIYLSRSKTNPQLDGKLYFWKNRTEFIFTIAMSLLLIYYFNPRRSETIDKETKILFFLFGWILIFTADWKSFFGSFPMFRL